MGLRGRIAAPLAAPRACSLLITSTLSPQSTTSSISKLYSSKPSSQRSKDSRTPACPRYVRLSARCGASTHSISGSHACSISCGSVSSSARLSAVAAPAKRLRTTSTSCCDTPRASRNPAREPLARLPAQPTKAEEPVAQETPTPMAQETPTPAQEAPTPVAQETPTLYVCHGD